MKTKLKIENACCEGCKTSIENHTKDIPGLISLSFDVPSQIAEVEHAEELLIEKLIEAIGSIGKGNYKAEVVA